MYFSVLGFYAKLQITIYDSKYISSWMSNLNLNMFKDDYLITRPPKSILLTTFPIYVDDTSILTIPWIKTRRLSSSAHLPHNWHSIWQEIQLTLPLKYIQNQIYSHHH